MERDEIIRWLKETDRAKLDGLYQKAFQVKLENLRNTICVHGIIAFSNYCIGGSKTKIEYGGKRVGCSYCGLQQRNRKLKRYRMKPQEIVSLAVKSANVHGYKMIVLQSGADPAYSDDVLAGIIKEIRRQARVLLFLSIGERNPRAYEKLWQAGARGMLFRFETSDPELYSTIHPGGSLERRLDHIKRLKDIGFIIASGPLLGIPSPDPDCVPDQTPQSIADDILLMKELDVKMATLGPYVRATGSLLSILRPEVKCADPELVLKTIALTRLAIPRVRIPCTTALEAVGVAVGSSVTAIRRRALRAGATAFMTSLTPDTLRKHYALYQGKNSVQKNHARSFAEIIDLIKSEGGKLCNGFGGKDDLTKKDFNEGLCAVDH